MIDHINIDDHAGRGFNRYGHLDAPSRIPCGAMRATEHNTMGFRRGDEITVSREYTPGAQFNPCNPRQWCFGTYGREWGD